MNIKSLLAALVVSLSLAAPVLAGPSEDGLAAYQRGDYAEALKWFRKAAEQGNALAQFSLGAMNATGKGVRQDFVEAHKWSNLAAAHGNKKAAKLRDRIAKKLTPAQIVEAQRLAREWKPQAEAFAIRSAPENTSPVQEKPSAKEPETSAYKETVNNPEVCVSKFNEGVRLKVIIGFIKNESPANVVIDEHVWNKFPFKNKQTLAGVIACRFAQIKAPDKKTLAELAKVPIAFNLRSHMTNKIIGEWRLNRLTIK